MNQVTTGLDTRLSVKKLWIDFKRLPKMGNRLLALAHLNIDPAQTILGFSQIEKHIDPYIKLTRAETARLGDIR